MKIQRFNRFAAACVLALAACGGSTTDGPATDLAGTETDAPEFDIAVAEVGYDGLTVVDTNPGDTHADTAGADDATTVPENVDCTKGSVLGVACAPSQQTFVSGALVKLDLTGPCVPGGLHLEATADAKGNYTFDNVPPGSGTIAFQKGSFQGSGNVEILPGQQTDLTGASKRCFKSSATSIAVITGDSDNIGELLDELGLQHTDFSDGTTSTASTSAAHALLTDPAKLAQYNVLFINCSGTVQGMFTKDPKVADNLAQFVADGHSLYASDWAWAYVEWAFPQAIDYYGADQSFTKGQSGPDNSDKTGPRQGPGPTLTEKKNGAKPTQVAASIIDPGLSGALGQTTTTIFYDLGTWVVIDTPGFGTTVHIQGKVSSSDGNWGTRPLAVSFHPNYQGRVVYPTFHNIAQADAGASVADIKAILSYLVFSL